MKQRSLIYLENANAEAQLMQVRMKIEQNLADIEVFKNELQTTLLNIDYEVDIISTLKLEKRSIQIMKDSIIVSDNPRLNYFLHQSYIIEKQKSVMKAENLPELRIGYFNQSMIGSQTVGGDVKYFNMEDRFSGVQFGVDIPIWFKANSAKVDAAEIQKVQAQTRATYYEKELLGEYKRVNQEFRKLEVGIHYYELQGLPHAALILDNPQRSFESGAINYIEYVNSVKAVLAIRYDYLGMLNDYNHVVVAIEYLLGK